MWVRYCITGTQLLVDWNYNIIRLANISCTLRLYLKIYLNPSHESWLYERTNERIQQHDLYFTLLNKILKYWSLYKTSSNEQQYCTHIFGVFQTLKRPFGRCLKLTHISVYFLKGILSQRNPAKNVLFEVSSMRWCHITSQLHHQHDIQTAAILDKLSTGPLG